MLLVVFLITFLFEATNIHFFFYTRGNSDYFFAIGFRIGVFFIFGLVYQYKNLAMKKRFVSLALLALFFYACQPQTDVLQGCKATSILIHCW